jgi:transcriptional regulator with XRE-family HTH domain
MTNLARIRKELSPARRQKVEARAAQLVAEEMTLRQLRQARKLTQVRMAEELNISQDGISKLEKRSDLLLSTLRKTIEGMGGDLSLVAQFPDRGPVVLAGIAEGPSAERIERKAETHGSGGLRAPTLRVLEDLLEERERLNKEIQRLQTLSSATSGSPKLSYAAKRKRSAGAASFPHKRNPTLQRPTSRPKN